MSVSLQESTQELSPGAGERQAAKENAKAKAKATSLTPVVKAKAKSSGKKQSNKSKADGADAAMLSEPKQKKPKTEVMKRPSALRRPAAAVESDAGAASTAAASPLAWFGASPLRIACRAAWFFLSLKSIPGDLSKPFWYKASSTWACKFKSTGKQPFSATCPDVFCAIFPMIF